ncbi:acetyl-CoA carboxylase [Chytridium lagenaria]|nr:acetyl-CoA carboxylase [Chytridium lagenaria]
MPASGAFGDAEASTELVRNRVITRILIANNGMAAVKAIRSIRRWSYESFGDDRAIQFTVMATPEDLKVNAEYIRMADQYVEVPGGTSNNNYANVDLIVDVAQRTHVQVKPILADKLTALDIVFIGPPSSAMRALGDKIASTIVAQSAKVPCALDGLQRPRLRPVAAYRAATTLDVNEGLQHADQIGYPVMIKASEGGGGKGIRLVEEPKDFKIAFEQVSREIPGSPIFIMRVIRNSRHLEVQLLADDCSVQRRHQKILEEAPVTVADADARARMEKAAVRLAQMVGYVSAAQPRLQVEHPTTEMVSGVNIPAAQLQIAMGIPLSCIKDIRILYGMTPTVLELNFRSNSNVWGYFSVNSSGGVHEYADSQFGHVFSYGETRNDARKNLIIALKELSIRGDFRTTVEYLIIETEKPDSILAALCGAVVKAHAVIDAQTNGTVVFLKRVKLHPNIFLLRITVSLAGPRTYLLTCLSDGVTSQVTIDAKKLADGGLLLLIDGKTHLVYAKEEPHATFMTLDGKSCLLEKENDPTLYLVDDGAHLSTGDAFAEIEVMKMYMPLLATESGIVTFSLPPGSTLVSGDVVGRLVLDDPSRVKKAVKFDGQLPALGPPQMFGEKAHQMYQAVLDGYEFAGDMSGLVRRLVESLNDAELPFLEVSEVLSSLTSPKKDEDEDRRTSIISTASSEVASFPSEAILTVTEEAKASMSSDDLDQFTSRIKPLEDLVEAYHGTARHRERSILARLIDRFLEVEETFNDKRYEDVLLSLRDKHKNDLDKAVGMALAHSKSSLRCELVLKPTPRRRVRRFSHRFAARLAELQGAATAKVSLKGRELLIYFQLPTYEERHSSILNVLQSAVSGGQANHAILDVLPATALYTYVLHTYQAYTVISVKHGMVNDPPSFQWDFAQKAGRGSLGLCQHSSSNLANMSHKGSSGSTQRSFNIADRTGSFSDLGLYTTSSLGSNASRRSSPIANVMNIAIRSTGNDILSSDERAYEFLSNLVAHHGFALRGHSVRRVTFMVVRSNQFPRYFTFKEQDDYREDPVIRHIEPAMAYQLELQRLQNFEIKLVSLITVVSTFTTLRFFVRAIVYPGQAIDQVLKASTHDTRYPTPTATISSSTSSPRPTDLPAIETTLKEFVDRHGRRLWKGESPPPKSVSSSRFQRHAKPIRFILSSVSGFVTKVEAYRKSGRHWCAKTHVFDITVGSLYALKENIQPKRYKAHLMGTTYVYDFAELFRRALEKVWIKYSDGFASIVEETFREPGLNNCGMVAWNMELFTPEYPEGRNIVVVANDITFNIGSFGPKEDQLFFKASEYARNRGIPVSTSQPILVPVLDWQMKSLRGLSAAYTERECGEDEDEGEIRYRIVDVIGQTHGLGVENLQGSGLIAGETSQAYKEIFTLTLVTCRSVGIGAYLVRLGQRTIQVEYTPVILTGAAALNKVLGREVYTSNLQLGGTQIMYKNGVSHLVAQNDMGDYVPKKKDAPLPVLPATDSVDRPISVEIPSGAYDPRNLLEVWYPGFFDQDSFKETLAGWAQGVVVGRGRLGGIPMGVICVETRATEQVIYADPANEQSVEQTSVEAGQVWYPNSSFKTAQAINDFNNGEQLPLIIFANWRGFSGGQSDIKPVFIYVIGELRGGAWVVLDPTINSEHMEMYAEEEARGGIKFRKPQLLAAMDRLDPTYKDLKKRLRDTSLLVEARADLQAQIDQREKQLLPVFHQVAVQFADLHDTPGRMLKKGAISAVVPWRSARKFFYWRLLRRISEDSVIREVLEANPQLTRSAAKDLVAQCAMFDSSDEDDEPADEFRDGDLEVVRWLNTKRTNITSRISKIKESRVRAQVEEMVRSDPQVALEGFLTAAKSLDAERRRAVIEALSRGV